MTQVVACLTAFIILGQQVFIRLNQLGFAPGDVKTAVVFGNDPLPAYFIVHHADTGDFLFSGKVRPVAGRWGKFDSYAELDFSSVRTQGRFVVDVGNARSLPFTISAVAYSGIVDQLLEFMRQQRCGYNPFVEAQCHTFDGRTAF